MTSKRIEHDSRKNSTSPEKDRDSRLKKALRANLRLRKNGSGNGAVTGVEPDGEAAMRRRERPVSTRRETDEA